MAGERELIGNEFPQLDVSWLPKAGNCKNFALAFTFRPRRCLRAPERAIPRKRRGARVPPLMRAYEFQGLLDSGEVNTRAEIARRYGISRARVTQIMHLLKLSESVQEYLIALPQDKQTLYSERRLRPLLADRGQGAQIEALRELVASVEGECR